MIYVCVQLYVYQDMRDPKCVSSKDCLLSPFNLAEVGIAWS